MNAVEKRARIMRQFVREGLSPTEAHQLISGMSELRWDLPVETRTAHRPTRPAPRVRDLPDLPSSAALRLRIRVARRRRGQ